MTNTYRHKATRTRYFIYTTNPLFSNDTKMVGYSIDIRTDPFSLLTSVPEPVILAARSLSLS